MTRVLVFGAFDLFHKGHEHFLKNAKRFGDELVVVVGRDINLYKLKKKNPINNEDARLKKIKSLDYVTEAFLGRKDLDYMITIKKIKPDVICLGYDQKSFNIERKIKNEELKIRIIRLGPYKEKTYKTTILRELLKF
jgi:cytidyltransferase-like protein